MEGKQHPARVALRATREQVISHLSEAFARDEIGLDEFERRIDAVYRCRAPEELTALVGDLSPPSPPKVRDADLESTIKADLTELVPIPIPSRTALALPVPPRTIHA